MARRGSSAVSPLSGGAWLEGSGPGTGTAGRGAGSIINVCGQHGGQVVVHVPHVSSLRTRELGIRRGLWEVRQHREFGFTLKFVRHSVGSGESLKSVEHDRSTDRLDCLGNQPGRMCKMN